MDKGRRAGRSERDAASVLVKKEGIFCREAVFVCKYLKRELVTWCISEG
jgi:hypothetical protein